MSYLFLSSFAISEGLMLVVVEASKTCDSSVYKEMSGKFLAKCASRALWRSVWCAATLTVFCHFAGSLVSPALLLLTRSLVQGKLTGAWKRPGGQWLNGLQAGKGMLGLPVYPCGEIAGCMWWGPVGVYKPKGEFDCICVGGQSAL